MERLSDLSLRAAIAFENLRQGRPSSDQPIQRFIAALCGEQHDPAERARNLASDYRRAGLYREAWREVTGITPDTYDDLVQQVSQLLESMQSDIEHAPEELERARDFCIALNRAFVDVEYENLNTSEYPGFKFREA